MGVITTFPLSVAARAAQISSRKQRRLIDTGVTPLLGNDVKPGGSGYRVGLSRARILQTATAEALWKTGVALSTAAKAALAFSDCGNTGREAGQLYPVGKTVLLVNRDEATVKNIFSDTSFSELSNGAACVTVVDMNKIVTQINSVLYHFQKAFHD